MARAITPNSQTSSSRATRTKEIADQIMPASKAKGPLKMVLYGRNGKGKTHFAGSSNLKTLVVDCQEKGTESLEDRPNVDVLFLQTWDDLQYIYWHLRDGDHPYEVVVIDTITSLSTLCMKWVLKDDNDRGSSEDPLMPGRQQYGKLGEAMTNMIIDWRNLPYVVIFLAQERSYAIKDDNDEVIGSEIGPSMTPKPLGTLLSAVGTIGRMTDREVTKQVNGKSETVTEWRMLVRGDDKYIAKTRIKGLKKQVINPSLAKLIRIRNTQGEVAEGQVAQSKGDE